jgi:hypothetical protein
VGNAARWSEVALLGVRAQGGVVTFSFDPATHTYRVGGVIFPSVTEVLGPAEAFAGFFDHVPADALELARDRGSYVHEAMALLARGDLDWSSLDETWAPYIRSGERFLSDSGIVITGSEVPVFSERLRVAGTIDLLGLWTRREALLDFKASAAVPVTVGPQTAGYTLLYRDLYGSAGKRMRRYCVHLTPAEYRVIPLEDSRDEAIFLSSLNLFHWGARHADRAVAA